MPALPDADTLPDIASVPDVEEGEIIENGFPPPVSDVTSPIPHASTSPPHRKVENHRPHAIDANWQADVDKAALSPHDDASSQEPPRKELLRDNKEYDLLSSRELLAIAGARAPLSRCHMDSKIRDMLSPRWGPGHVGQELGKTVVEVDYMGRVWMMLDALEEIAYYDKNVC